MAFSNLETRIIHEMWILENNFHLITILFSWQMTKNRTNLPTSNIAFIFRTCCHINFVHSEIGSREEYFWPQMNYGSQEGERRAQNLWECKKMSNLKVHNFWFMNWKCTLSLFGAWIMQYEAEEKKFDKCLDNSLPPPLLPPTIQS